MGQFELAILALTPAAAGLDAHDPTPLAVRPGGSAHFDPDRAVASPDRLGDDASANGGNGLRARGVILRTRCGPLPMRVRPHGRPGHATVRAEDLFVDAATPPAEALPKAGVEIAVASATATRARRDRRAEVLIVMTAPVGVQWVDRPGGMVDSPVLNRLTSRAVKTGDENFWAGCFL
jgi:hypothetical protein